MVCFKTRERNGKFEKGVGGSSSSSNYGMEWTVSVLPKRVRDREISKFLENILWWKSISCLQPTPNLIHSYTKIFYHNSYMSNNSKLANLTLSKLLLRLIVGIFLFPFLFELNYYF